MASRVIFLLWQNNKWHQKESKSQVYAAMGWLQAEVFHFSLFSPLTSCQLFSMLCSGNVTHHPLQSHHGVFPWSFHPMEESNSRFYSYQWSNISLKTERLKRKGFLGSRSPPVRKLCQAALKNVSMWQYICMFLGASWQAGAGFTCEQTTG